LPASRKPFASDFQKPNFKRLAICRGHQLLNVALVGTLFVDISLQKSGALKHSQMDRKSEVVHAVSIQVGSQLAQILDTSRLGVNSTHHPAVEKVAKPLCVCAVSIDGIVEGMELAPGQRHLLPFLLSVQFHPERLFARHREHFELLRSFICASSRNRRARV
jgi:putative glutamine amidotransferase